MFKKLLICAVTLSLAFLLTTAVISAQEKEINESEEANASTKSATVRYNLAFPGMLPDHPLYKLKVFRDKITAVVTSDPRKKIEFYLRQTDKGILASAMLVDKGKVDLAAETALKAEHNYTLITQQVYRLAKKPDDEFFNQLEKAALKHQEVLVSLGMRVPEDKRKTFFLVADFSKTNLQSIEEYKSGSNDSNQYRNR